VKRRILSGTFVLSAGAMSDYYERAVVIRERIRQDFDACFESGVDVLMTPTTPSGPFRVQEQSEDDPVAMYLNDVMTIPANMAGVPSISVPTALTTNTLPLGIQLMGARKHEEDMFQVAKALQKYARFDRLVPEQVYQPRA
jgi:aspartyl-tRNA(Asn)/glutamyl-tRNA(Gln) amidotransferase subunit A